MGVGAGALAAHDRRVRVLLFLLSFVFAAPAMAQEWNAFTQCEGEGPAHVFRDVCSPAYLRRIQHAFGVPSLAQVAGDHRAVRVVVIEGREYGDGVSQFTILIDAIERGGDVHLIVRAVPSHTRRLYQRARVTREQWNEVAALAASLETAPGVAPWRDDLWLHPAEFVVQTQGFGASRTLYTTMAEGGPAQVMVALLVAHATAALPRCDAQESPWRLRDCLQRRRR